MSLARYEWAPVLTILFAACCSPCALAEGRLPDAGPEVYARLVWQVGRAHVVNKIDDAIAALRERRYGSGWSAEKGHKLVTVQVTWKLPDDYHPKVTLELMASRFEARHESGKYTTGLARSLGAVFGCESYRDDITEKRSDTFDIAFSVPNDWAEFEVRYSAPLPVGKVSAVPARGPEATGGKSTTEGDVDAPPETEAEAAAKRLLNMARNFIANRRRAEARPYLERVLKEYPQTKAAEQAKALLAERD